MSKSPRSKVMFLLSGWCHCKVRYSKKTYKQNKGARCCRLFAKTFCLFFKCLFYCQPLVWVKVSRVVVVKFNRFRFALGFFGLKFLFLELLCDLLIFFVSEWHMLCLYGFDEELNSTWWIFLQQNRFHVSLDMMWFSRSVHDLI